MAPRLEQNEQLQRIPFVIGSASNEKRIAPQWQLPLYGCITIFLPLLKYFGADPFYLTRYLYGCINIILAPPVCA